MAGQRLIQKVDVFRATDEGIAEHIGAFEHSREIVIVFIRERRKVEFRIREV